MPSDRDLVDAIRAELATIDPARPCDRLAEAAGLGPVLTTREPAILRLALRLGGVPTPVAPGALPTATRHLTFDVPPLRPFQKPQALHQALSRASRKDARPSISAAYSDSATSGHTR